MGEFAQREYEELKTEILNFIAERDGRCQFEELDAWGRERGRQLTLRTALIELIEAGELKGSDEIVADDFAPWVKIPKEITLERRPPSLSRKGVPPPPFPGVKREFEHSVDQEFDAEPKLRRVIEYLNDYPSVGLMRFNIDLLGLKITDTNRILRRLSEDGFVEVSPLGVVNATPRLPKITRKVTLGDLLGSDG